jgi:hypothetical protein
VISGRRQELVACALGLAEGALELLLGLLRVLRGAGKGVHTVVGLAVRGEDLRLFCVADGGAGGHGKTAFLVLSRRAALSRSSASTAAACSALALSLTSVMRLSFASSVKSA